MAEGTTAEVRLSQGDLEKMSHFGKIDKGPKKNPLVDKFLADVRARQHEPRDRAGDASDLIAFFRAGADDAQENGRTKEITSLKKLQDTAADIALGREVEDLGPIRSYVNTQHTYWERGAKELKGEEQEFAEANEKTFKRFQDLIENRPQVLEEIEVGQEELDMVAGETIKVAGQPELPKYTFRGDKSDEFLNQIEETQLTPQLLKNYLTAAREDIYAQRKEFKEQNGTTITAVASAVEYYSSHQNSTEDIIVVLDKDEVTYVGSRQSAPSKGQTFEFNLTDPQSSRNLGLYNARVNTYEERMADVDRGIRVTEKLIESDSGMIDDAEDRLSMVRVLQLHKEHLDELDDDSLGDDKKARITKQKNILKDFSALIKSRTEGADEELEEVVDDPIPTTGNEENAVKRVFKRAGRKLTTGWKNRK